MSASLLRGSRAPDRGGWGDLARATVALAWAHWVVRVGGDGAGLVTVARRGGPDGGPADSPEEESLVRARALAGAVRHVASLDPLRPSCLTRALALRRLLEWNHLTDGVVRIGVRSDPPRFEAHAWLEYGGEVLGDPGGGGERFEVLEDVDVGPRP